jgi:hypothetical protein
MSTRKPAARKAAPKASAEVPQGRRGVRSDIAKYELFAQWAEKELGFKLDPAQAQFTVLQYKNFQASDLNRKFNAAKSAALAKGRKQAAKAAAARTGKSTPTTPKRAATSPTKAAKAPAKTTARPRTRKAAA